MGPAKWRGSEQLRCQLWCSTGSSLSFGLYWVVSFVALSLLCCACTFAASYTACSWEPCWLTIAQGIYMHGWQPCECWVHLPVGSWPLWQVCSVPLPQVIWLVPCPEGYCGRLNGMSNVGCTRHPSKKYCRGTSKCLQSCWGLEKLVLVS